MFGSAVRIARIGGIEVRLDPSLPLFALLVVWTFSTRFADTRSFTAGIIMALAATLLFFASILAHELAHAFEARHRNLEVVGITLTLFGGVTEMHAGSQTPRDELVIAAVGPWISLVCGAVFGLVATFVPDVLSSGTAEPIAEVAGLLGWLNVILAFFNMVPGAPLDGGRILRAVLWRLLDDRQRAVRVAARAGQALALAIMAGGGWIYLQQPRAAFTAAMLVVVGMFLFSGARNDLRHSQLDVLFTARTVAELVGRLPDPIPVDQPLDLLDERRQSDGADLLSVADDGVIVGVLTVGEVASLHATDRSIRTAGDIASSVAGLPAVDLTDDLHTIVERLQGGNDRVRIERDGHIVGVVTEREIARALAALQASGRSGRGQPTRHLPPPADAEVRR